MTVWCSSSCKRHYRQVEAPSISNTRRHSTPRFEVLYRVESGGRAYAFTQFESISARLAFPCFDEPRFKTPFDVTLTVPADQIVVANTPVDRAIALAEGLQRVNFVPTPPLPTYLVAWAVGPLDVVAGPTIPPNERRPFPIPLRGVAAEGRGGQLQYALDRSGEFVEALEDYFGIPYPYRKLDLVAVPRLCRGRDGERRADHVPRVAAVDRRGTSDRKPTANIRLRVGARTGSSMVWKPGDDALVGRHMASTKHSPLGWATRSCRHFTPNTVPTWGASRPHIVRCG